MPITSLPPIDTREAVKPRVEEAHVKQDTELVIFKTDAEKLEHEKTHKGYYGRVNGKWFYMRAKK